MGLHYKTASFISINTPNLTRTIGHRAQALRLAQKPEPVDQLQPQSSLKEGVWFMGDHLVKFVAKIGYFGVFDDHSIVNWPGVQPVSKGQAKAQLGAGDGRERRYGACRPDRYRSRGRPGRAFQILSE